MNNATPSGATAQLPSLDTTAATPLDLNDFRQIQMDAVSYTHLTLPTKA